MSIDPEKKQELEEKGVAVATSSVDNEELRAGGRHTAEQRLVRKLDVWLLPTVVIIYLMNYIDVRRVAGVMQYGTRC